VNTALQPSDVGIAVRVPARGNMREAPGNHRCWQRRSGPGRVDVKTIYSAGRDHSVVPRQGPTSAAR